MLRTGFKDVQKIARASEMTPAALSRTLGHVKCGGKMEYEDMLWFKHRLHEAGAAARDAKRLCDGAYMWAHHYHISM